MDDSPRAARYKAKQRRREQARRDARWKCDPGTGYMDMRTGLPTQRPAPALPDLSALVRRGPQERVRSPRREDPTKAEAKSLYARAGKYGRLASSAPTAAQRAKWNRRSDRALAGAEAIRERLTKKPEPAETVAP